MIHQYFPEAFIQLQIEIGHHPRLMERIQKHPQIEMELIFAEVCHYVGYAINGTFDQGQLEEIADKLITLLRNMSVVQVISQVTTSYRQ